MVQIPPITIVIPVYNRAGIVKRTLDSVAKQSFRPLHVILVDNASTDNTLDVLEQWKCEQEGNGLSVEILQEPVAGACNARNKGLEHVKSPYLMFFDSDDEMAPNHVERAMTLLENNPDADIVGWDVDCISLSGKHRKLIFAPNDFMFNHIFHASLSTQRYVCKTELINRVGRWDKAIFGWDDYELGVRMLLQNPQIIYAGSELTVTVHNLEQSITGIDFSSSPDKWEHPLDVCASHLQEANRLDELKWIETRRIILAGHYLREGNNLEGNRLLGEVLERATSLKDRIFYKMACRYVAHGGRGVAILAKIFL